jgi:3-aminobutyryl-CoA ammonia-lyase
MADDPRLGLSVVHRRYVPYSHAHYAGSLVDGAYSLALFGDVATEVCIRTDGDEGLFASYSDVQFKAPVRAGDVLEIEARVVRVGRRSRTLEFEARVVCRAVEWSGDSASGTAADAGSASASEALAEPIVATTATGTVVVP